MKQQGPLLSGELLRIMENEEPGISAEAIRKRLSRIQHPVKRLFGFFADNQTFYYLEDEFRTDLYFSRLQQAVSKSAKRLDAYLAAIQFHKGFIEINHLATYGYCPIEKLKGHKLHQAYVDWLLRFGFIKLAESWFELNPDFSTDGESAFKQYKAEETARNLILSQFMGWARSIGLISYNAGTFYSSFGKFQWCFTCPAYVNGIREYKDNTVKPFFVVADVLIGKEVTERNVHYFIEKVKILNAQKGISRFMPFLIVESLNEGAFKLLKENGIIIGFVNKLFGKEYSSLLSALVNTIVNAGAILKKNPEEFLSLIKRIDKLVDGKTNNLRGDLFELAVGYYHRHSQNIDIGKEINYVGDFKEIDVLAIYPNALHVAECKGYKSKLTITEVEDWLKKISIVRKWMLEIEPYKNKEFIAELWSTGGFEDDALHKIKEVAEKTKKYKVVYFDQTGILQKFREIKSKKVLDVLKQYFFNDEL